MVTLADLFFTAETSLLTAQLTNVNQKWFCYSSVIWMAWNLNLNECEQPNHITVYSSDSQAGALKQDPGGPWK